jgi:hypothetical protein
MIEMCAWSFFLHYLQNYSVAVAMSKLNFLLKLVILRSAVARVFKSGTSRRVKKKYLTREAGFQIKLSATATWVTNLLNNRLNHLHSVNH